MENFLISLFFLISILCPAQEIVPHVNAHAHNDYEHAHPLKDALQNGFTSVEADVYFQKGELLVSHNQPSRLAQTLDKLYLAPLDSILRANKGYVYPGFENPFFLMIDCKTGGAETYNAIRKAVSQYSSLACSAEKCRVKIFLSGNRPADIMLKDSSSLGIDGHPEDVGKGISSSRMPVVSDNFNNQSKWKGKSYPTDEELSQVRGLASKIHGEGKLFRLWAIPDNEIAWGALLEAGVDLINTDRLPELNQYLLSKGL